ncbi:hypothetical protein Nepgr_011517 [Nepenthes gracilis]|uniref:Uncharacterized protein n=1 Tax=Nepenthes gracilis TaxID=150966 RepID=A0AAD3XMG6_NEPGR|nr:hypothetical protein Nepgr_011517 [Nepenthes gracilis]
MACEEETVIGGDRVEDEEEERITEQSSAWASSTIIFSILLSPFLLSCWTLANEVLKMIADRTADYDLKVRGVEISPGLVASGQPATFSNSALAAPVDEEWGSRI